MKDASPRFAEGQACAASLSSSEESNLRLAELAQHAVGLNAWVTGVKGCEGATAGASSSMNNLPQDDCPRWTSSSCAHTCRPRLCTLGPMDWRNGYTMATRIKKPVRGAAVLPGVPFRRSG